MSVVQQYNHSLTQRHLFSREQQNPAKQEKLMRNRSGCRMSVSHFPWRETYQQQQQQHEKIKDVAPEKNKLCQRLDGAVQIHGNACIRVYCSPGYDIGKT